MKIIVWLFCLAAPGLALLSREPEWPDYSQPPRIAALTVPKLGGLLPPRQATQQASDQLVYKIDPTPVPTTSFGKPTVIATGSKVETDCPEDENQNLHPVTLRVPDATEIPQEALDKVIRVYTLLANKIANGAEGTQKVPGITEEEVEEERSPPVSKKIYPPPTIDSNPTPTKSTSTGAMATEGDFKPEVKQLAVSDDDLALTHAEDDIVFKHHEQKEREREAERRQEEGLDDDDLNEPGVDEPVLLTEDQQQNEATKKPKNNRRLFRRSADSVLVPNLLSEAGSLTRDDSAERGGILASLGSLWHSISDGILSYTAQEPGSRAVLGFPQTFSKRQTFALRQNDVMPATPDQPAPVQAIGGTAVSPLSTDNGA